MINDGLCPIYFELLIPISHVSNNYICFRYLQFNNLISAATCHPSYALRMIADPMIWSSLTSHTNTVRSLFLFLEDPFTY